MQKLKNILSVFILAVFLFPLAENEIHNFAHLSDNHCTSSDYHFHTVEHHCNLCDFNFDNSFSPTFNSHTFVLSELRTIDFFFSENNILLQKKYFTSLRAPPALV